MSRSLVFASGWEISGRSQPAGTRPKPSQRGGTRLADQHRFNLPQVSGLLIYLDTVGVTGSIPVSPTVCICTSEVLFLLVRTGPLLCIGDQWSPGRHRPLGHDTRSRGVEASAGTSSSRV